MSSTAIALSRAAVTAAGTTVMAEGRRYRVALVPAFVTTPAELVPAWDLDTPADPVELAVYDSWTFTTAGDLVMTMCPLGASSSIQTQRSG